MAQVVTRFIAGAGGVALRGALALDRQRYTVTILSQDGGPLLQEAARAGFEVVRLRHMRAELNPWEDQAGLVELRHALRAGRFDVVHTHSTKAGVLGRLAAHQVGVPAIVHTFHGFPFHAFQSRLRRAAYIAVERRIGRQTDQFLGIGSAVAAEAVRLRIAPPDRMRAIASAIDPAIPPVTLKSRILARRLLGLPAGARVIGTVGRLDFQKAPDDMLAAFLRLDRDAVLVWIGDGPWYERMARVVSRAGLESRVLLLGERHDVPDLLPAFDVFAMASRYEGLPCSVVEAMTCGIPVVATAVNAVPDVVVAGQTGLLAPAGDPPALAAALAWMLEHPAPAQRMAAAAQELIGARFDPRYLGQDLMQTYELALLEPVCVRARAEHQPPAQPSPHAGGSISVPLAEASK